MSKDINGIYEPIVDLIDRRQIELGKSDEQIAHELGFDRVTAFNIIKQGSAKLPIQKVSMLASALSIDPASSLRKLLTEEMPDLLDAIDTWLIPHH